MKSKPAQPKKRGLFTRFARGAAHAAGMPGTFLVAVAVIIAWALTGPIFGFNDTWQLVINTSTTIVTFLMVFLIQNAQNRDSAAIQLKLDEIIRALESAHNSLIDLEELEEDEIDAIRCKFREISKAAREELRQKDNPLDAFEP